MEDLLLRRQEKKCYNHLSNEKDEQQHWNAAHVKLKQQKRSNWINQIVSTTPLKS